MASVAFRSYLSISFLQAAAFLCLRSSHAEHTLVTGREKMAADELDELLAVHRSYVMGAIISCVAFLEGLTNEILEDATGGGSIALCGMREEEIHRLKGLGRKLGRTRSIGKYQAVLDALGKAQFDEEKSPCEEIGVLVKLRNALIHARPETVSATRAPPASQCALFERLLSTRFEHHQMLGAGNPFFPDRCLSHGCAAWANNVSIGFADRFCQMIRIPAPYAHVRHRIHLGAGSDGQDAPVTPAVP